jgi:hypothetical protein
MVDEPVIGRRPVRCGYVGVRNQESICVVGIAKEERKQNKKAQADTVNHERDVSTRVASRTSAILVTHHTRVTFGIVYRSK